MDLQRAINWLKTAKTHSDRSKRLNDFYKYYTKYQDEYGPVKQAMEQNQDYNNYHDYPQEIAEILSSGSDKFTPHDLDMALTQELAGDYDDLEYQSDIDDSFYSPTGIVNPSDYMSIVQEDTDDDGDIDKVSIEEKNEED